MSRRGAFVPPNYPPPPTELANHVSVARYRRGKTKISRTSLMHSFCVKNIKKSAERHKRGWGRWAEPKQRGWMFSTLPLHHIPQRGTGNEKELVCGAFVVTRSYRRTQPWKSHNVLPLVLLHSKAITLCPILRRQLYLLNCWHLIK